MSNIVDAEYYEIIDNSNNHSYYDDTNREYSEARNRLIQSGNYTGNPQMTWKQLITLGLVGVTTGLIKSWLNNK